MKNTDDFEHLDSEYDVRGLSIKRFVAEESCSGNSDGGDTKASAKNAREQLRA